MTREIVHTTKITNQDGQVFMSLLDGDYVRLTPPQAEQLAARLFVQSAKAQGRPIPGMILLQGQEGGE